jgi:hypothetical protein
MEQGNAAVYDLLKGLDLSDQANSLAVASNAIGVICRHGLTRTFLGDNPARAT